MINRKVELADAIVSLVPGAQVRIVGEKVDWINPSQAPVTDQQIQDEIIRLQNQYDNNEYQRKRAEEYPSFADQFDLLYHGGYDVWKTAIQQIKDKYPK